MIIQLSNPKIELQVQQANYLLQCKLLTSVIEFIIVQTFPGCDLKASLRQKRASSGKKIERRTSKKCFSAF